MLGLTFLQLLLQIATTMLVLAKVMDLALQVLQAGASKSVDYGKHGSAFGSSDEQN